MNTILAPEVLPGYVVCPDDAGIGWTTSDSVNFSPPSVSVDIDEFRAASLTRLLDLRNLFVARITPHPLRCLAALNSRMTMFNEEAAITGETAENIRLSVIAEFVAVEPRIGKIYGRYEQAKSTIEGASTVAQIKSVLDAVYDAISND